MPASNGHRRSARVPGAFSLAAATLVAAWSAGAMLSGSVMAAGETPTATPGISRPGEYDPFELPAPVAFAATAAVANPPRDFDPFDLLSSAPAAETSTVVFQVGGPTLSEPLPSPPGADQKADDDAAAAANWSPTPLDQLSTNIVLPGGLLPRNYWADRPPQAVAFFDPCGATRGWPVSSLCWEASAFCHNPLYFEEINLERYGYGCCACLQPAVSACHFFATVPALPYKMAVDCPGECDYTLGHYRPGSCPPRRFHCCSRVSGLGGLSEAGVLTGMIFLIP